MKTSNFKFQLLAVLCLLLVVPIFGYVQKQIALAPRPQPDGTSRREQRWAQREALRRWLLQQAVTVAVVTISPDDPHIVTVVMKPTVTPAQSLALARHVQQAMSVYFHEGQSGPVTVVKLQTSQGQDALSVVTGLLDKKNLPVSSWHIVKGQSLVQ